MSGGGLPGEAVEVDNDLLKVTGYVQKLRHRHGNVTPASVNKVDGPQVRGGGENIFTVGHGGVL